MRIVTSILAVILIASSCYGLETVVLRDATNVSRKAAVSAAGAVSIDGTVTATAAAATTVYNGQKTIASAGSQAAIAASTTVKSVCVKALPTNTGYIYVGDSNVDSTNGFVLKRSESVTLDIANLATVYIDVSVNGEGVSYVAIN